MYIGEMIFHSIYDIYASGTEDSQFRSLYTYEGEKRHEYKVERGVMTIIAYCY